MYYMVKSFMYVTGQGDAEERREAGILFLRARLHTWYKRQGILQDDARVYPIDNLTAKMLGPPANPKLKSKAAEARCMVGFAYELLLEFESPLGGAGPRESNIAQSSINKHAVHSVTLGCFMFACASVACPFRGTFLVRSLAALQEHYKIMASEERVLSHDIRSRLFDACKTCILAYAAAGGSCIPKCHLWVHMCMLTCLHGNAKYYNTFVDESMNGTIKEIAKRCHSSTFQLSVFRRILLGDPLLYPDR